MERFTFRKCEHLCLKSEIEALFSAGCSSMSMFPLRATFRLIDYSGNGPQAKILFSVSKKHFKHAVDRNRAKRQLREAYRLQKSILLNALPSDKAAHIAFIWLSNKPIKSDIVSTRMRNILLRIADKVQHEM